jgi:hypothetical protein
VSKEQWDAVCAERFAQVITTQEKQAASIGEIREKLFDGVSTASALVPGIKEDVAVLGVKVDQLLKRKAGASMHVYKKRGLDAAVIGVIVAAVSQWDKIAEFIARFF